jgi:UDP-N-acetylmuramoyl-L-alanyl-D-glutamate--2,6-diaminopimelate ligase
VLVELDRGTAIRLARALAGDDGVVVVAGKGHETDQLIGGKTLPWDDRAFVRQLGMLGKTP